MDIEIIKYHLQSFYKDNNNEEANAFFKNIINSESDRPILYEILMQIIIEDDDINLKIVSITLIREMDFNIFNSILILNQKMEPEQYQIIEILTDYLARRKRFQLTQEIDEIISEDLDILTQKAIVQLLASLFYLIEDLEDKPDEYKIAFPNYYTYFLQAASALVSSEKLDENETIFLYYFLKSFQDVIINSRDSSKVFIHNLTCSCLNQKISNNLFNQIIDLVLYIYSYFIRIYMNEMPVAEFLNYFDEYCQSTHYISEQSLCCWGSIFIHIPKFESLPENLGDFIINYVFIFFKFQPSLIDDDLEQFLYELSPDVNEIPLKRLFTGLLNTPYYQPLSDFVFHFSDSYFQQYIDQDIIEICRILIFTSRFTFYPCQEHEQYLSDFYVNKIFPLINGIDLTRKSDVYLAISICEFISTTNIKNILPVFENFEYIQILVNFLKWSILCPFERSNAYKLLFFCAVRAFANKFANKNYIQFFEFDEKDKYEIFFRLYQLNTEIQTYSMNELLAFLIKNMLPSELSIQQFSKTVWNLIISLNDCISPFLLSEYFRLLELLFSRCDDEAKEVFFEDFFSLLNDEMYGPSDWIINDCFNNVISLMTLFADCLLDSSEKLPLFMSTVGEFIKNILFHNETENLQKGIINDVVFLYEIFTFEIFKYSDDPKSCIDMIIEPFLIPIVCRFNQLLDKYNTFSFDSLNSPLIKFKGDEDIFQCMWEFYQAVSEMEFLDPESKCNFLTSLIISNPSLLFEEFDQDQVSFVFENGFPKSILYLHFLALREILVYISNVNPTKDIYEAILSSFTQRIEDEKNELYNEEEFDYDFRYDRDNRLFCDNDIFTEDFKDIMDEIKRILSSLEA